MTNIKDQVYFVNREQEERHTEELAKKLNLTYVNLTTYPLTEDVLSILASDICSQYQIVPYLKIGKSVKVGMVQPNNSQTKTYLDSLAKTTGLVFTPVVISKTSFAYALAFYEKIQLAKLEKRAAPKAVEEDFFSKIKDIKSASEVLKSANISKLFELISVGAVKTKASDIHIEPGEETFKVRYRIDGMLQDIVTLPLPQHKQLTSRIKYLAKLRMDIADQPQDGRITIKVGEEDIDLRISIMPSTWGEAVVIRLLGQEKTVLKLDNLGIRSDALTAIKQAITKPYGMILTSGPTGSGKTSTLYAILTELKKPGVKIITLENPVEYRIEDVEQSQVKPGAGYEFADGLRASLRQDPDILMVGEVRDADTAETAVQAALTGHLLLSTIHANSAPAVFARLIEIGVKPFLLSGSVNLIMAQRLVRKICGHCTAQYQPQAEIWEEAKKTLAPLKNRLNLQYQQLLNSEAVPYLKKGKGCEFCNKTGFLGRQMIIEVLVPDDKIEALIIKKAAISEFEKAATDQGMVTMEEDGLMRALAGLTTIDEVWRVTRS